MAEQTTGKTVKDASSGWTVLILADDGRTFIASDGMSRRCFYRERVNAVDFAKRLREHGMKSRVVRAVSTITASLPSASAKGKAKTKGRGRP